MTPPVLNSNSVPPQYNQQNTQIEPDDQQQPSNINSNQTRFPRPQPQPQPPSDSLPPFPKFVTHAPPRIKFGTTTYAINPLLYTNPSTPHPGIGKPFADIIVIVLKHGIQALEAKTGTKITSLNAIKIIQDVEQDGEEEGQGKLRIQYRYKEGKEIKTAEVEIDDSFKLSEEEQTAVCKFCELLSAKDSTSATCGGCHLDHKTVKKAYVKAMTILGDSSTFTDGEKKTPHTAILEPLTWDSLPQTFKDKLPQKPSDDTEIKQEGDPSKTNQSSSNNDPPKQLPNEPLGGLVKLNDSGSITYTDEEVKGNSWQQRPLLVDNDTTESKSNASAPSTTSWKDYLLIIFKRVIGNSHSTGSDKPEASTTPSSNPRWKDYLLKGIIRFSLPDDKGEGEGKVERSVTPITFEEKEAIDISIKMRGCRQRSLKHPILTDFHEFTPREQVFIKRLLLLLKRQLNKNSSNTVHGLLTTKFALEFGSTPIPGFGPGDLEENDRLIAYIKKYLEKVPDLS